MIGVTRAQAPSTSSARVNSDASRSEEHTSELQSPCNLVCRLLLEKKKKTPPRPRHLLCVLNPNPARQQLTTSTPLYLSLPPSTRDCSSPRRLAPRPYVLPTLATRP